MLYLKTYVPVKSVSRFSDVSLRPHNRESAYHACKSSGYKKTSDRSTRKERTSFGVLTTHSLLQGNYVIYRGCLKKVSSFSPSTLLYNSTLQKCRSHHGFTALKIGCQSGYRSIMPLKLFG